MKNSIEKEILFDVLNNPNDTFYENVLSDFLDEQGVEHDFRKSLHNNSVTELKPYQEKCLAVWANHWIDIGLCTKSTDEDKAEQYFFDLYSQLCFTKFKSIIWFNNPVEMCHQVSNWNQAVNQVWNQVYYQIWGRASNQINSRVWYQVSNNIWNHVWRQVGNHVWHKVWDQVKNYVWDHVKNQVWHGQQDAHWLVFYAYMMQVLRVEAPKQFALLMLLSQEVNWWTPTKETVFVTRKPKECIVENNKLVKLVYQDNYTIT
jgi:hypothetical protein